MNMKNFTRYNKGNRVWELNQRQLVAMKLEGKDIPNSVVTIGLRENREKCCRTKKNYCLLIPSNSSIRAKKKRPTTIATITGIRR